MAHVAAVALAAAATTLSGAMPTEAPMEWKGRLQLASDLATTAQVIDDLVAERTGVPRSLFYIYTLCIRYQVMLVYC